MKLPKIEWPTALVFVAGVLLVGACIRWKVDPEYLGAVALGVFALLANLKKVLKSDDDTKKDGDQ